MKHINMGINIYMPKPYKMVCSSVKIPEKKVVVPALVS